MCERDDVTESRGPGCGLEVSLASLLPDDVGFAGGPIAMEVAPLLLGEHSLIFRAGASRRAEFQAGRTYARRALRSLGIADQPILAAPDRRPLWPCRIVGAISHSSTHCAVAVARSNAYLGLGLDLEPTTPLDPDLIAYISRPEERDRACDLASTLGHRADPFKLLFSIKESCFKAIYPLTRVWFDFQDATVSLHPTEASFTLRLRKPLPRLHANAEVSGRWSIVDRHIVTAAFLQVPGEAP
jgi:4'-phosphopantetheinyl transferase EntD